MRFTPMSMALLASLTIASPAPAPAPAAVSARNVAETDLIAETIVFSVESAKCKLLKCATVIATGACILSALPDLESTLACVGGNAEDLCNCAGCVSGLNNWLTKEGICDAV